MKRLIGLLLIGAFLFLPAVSFASDGPTTTKVAFDDSDHLVTITADVVSDYIFIHNVDKTGPESVTDVGKVIPLDIDIKTNTFGLPSNFSFLVYEPATWRLYNEWLEYKDELASVHYLTLRLDGIGILNRQNCNC